MSQFYNKQQIDAQGAHMAVAINNRIKNAISAISLPKQLFLGTFGSVASLNEAIPSLVPTAGTYVFVDAGVDSPTELYLWDEDALEFVKSNINPEVVPNTPIEEAEDITSFTTAFDEALADSSNEL